MEIIENNTLLSIITRKPKCSSGELVNKMMSKGITFNDISPENAESYMLNNNNYLRLCSYRKNFSKHTKGINNGKYIDLDFNDLRVLANLDLQLRKSILGICMDIEHSIKLNILKECENNINDDGYTITFKFLQGNPYICKEIVKKSLHGHLTDLLSHYISTDYTNDSLECVTDRGEKFYLSIPIWVLLEGLTFNNLISFYEFYFQEIDKKLLIEKGVLNCVRSIRNACAHNNCILTELKSNGTKPVSSIKKFVRNKEISKDVTKKRLSCRVMYEIVCVVYANCKVANKSMIIKNMNILKNILNDFGENNENLLHKNDLLKSNYDFLKKILDK